MFGTIFRRGRATGARRPGRVRPRPSPRLVVENLEAREVPALDQVLDPTALTGGVTLSTSVSSINTDQEWAQTFTVGMSGVLSQVDLYMRRFSGDTGPFVMDIRATQADGRPTSAAGQELLTVTVPAAQITNANPADFIPFNLSGFNLNVTQGQKLAIVVHVGPATGGNVTYWFGGRSDDSYAAGAMYGRVIGNHDWIASGTGFDLGFKTYVEAAPSQPPVITLPGGPVAYAEGDPAVVIDPGATVTDPDTGIFDTGTLTASLTANGTADDRLAIRNEGTAAGQIGVSGIAVTFGGTIIGSWSGGVGTTPLVVNLNGSASLEAVQALVRNLTFANVSDNPATAPRTVQVVLNDGTGGISAPVTETVNVSATNDAPAVATNTGLTVAEGGNSVFGQAILAATDPDNTPAQLTYTVTAAPAHGTVRLNGNPVTTFTQADVNAGLVSYQHDGAEAATDAFSFKVSDGSAATATTVFNITVTPTNDPPVVATNTGLSVVQGAAVTLTPAKLSATDPDNTPAQLTYTVTAPPAHGSLLLNGNPASTFTQADINAGLVQYQHDGSGTAPDGFTFSVSDGTVSTAAATASINVLSSLGSFITVSGFNPTTGTVTFTGDGGGDPNDHLVLFAVDVGGGVFVLGHNLTDPGLDGNTDLDPLTPGVQQLILGSGTTPLISVNLLAGDDSLSIDNTGDHFTTPVAYDGGTGRDLLKLFGTLANTWTITGANTGTVTGTAVSFIAAEDLTGSAGDDAFVFAAGGAIGLLDGGAGANSLDYAGLSTPVEVFLSVGSATHTAGVTGIRTVLGGSAADLLVGGDAADVLNGGSGDDILVGGGGDDVLTGGAGNDILVGGADVDQVAETMPTALTVTLTNTSLHGGADTGVDLIGGIEGASLTGGPGNNLIRASAFTLGPVTLAGAAGNDKLFGGTQGDVLIGGDGKDNLIGGAGNDTFTGGLGNDILNGGPGDDMVREIDIAGSNVSLTGGALRTAANVLGTDTLFSIGRAFLSLAANETVGRTLNAAGFRAGPVTLVGGGGGDTLTGTVKAGDLLIGGAGNDTLNSGKGADTVDGGADLDVHVTLGGVGLDDIVSNVP